MALVCVLGIGVKKIIIYIYCYIYQQCVNGVMASTAQYSR